MYNDRIIEHVLSDKMMALKFDEALKGVATNLSKQAGRIGDGFIRLTWYSSCLNENYQEVCSKSKEEDVKFLLGLYQLIKRHDIVFNMVHIYVEYRLQRFEERNLLKNI